MMRPLKITALLTLMSAGIFAALLTWLVSSEQGSRWLLLQGLDMAPVTIEANGITGTLADGLGVEGLDILLPDVEIKATNILFSWNPIKLLAGIAKINNIRIADLGIDLLENKKSINHTDTTATQSATEQLFWLQLPILIHIESGKLDKLRIDNLEFNNLHLAGSIGHGQLEIENLNTETSGVNLQASGKLTGSGRGPLNMATRWEMPAQNLNGSGDFSGDIKELDFTHVINLPEAVNFNGSINDLFGSPTLTGIADWSTIQLPGEAKLYSNAGNFKVSSDFRSVQLTGDNTLLLENWQPAPMQLQVSIDLQTITIDDYNIDILDGQISGNGRIEYSDAIKGKVKINATQINTALINKAFPGQVGFDARLNINSIDAFAIDVTAAKALINEKLFTGLGRVQWQDEKLTALDASIKAGSNKLSAEIKLGTKLTGLIKANTPEMAMLWPGLLGKLDASITLGGTPKQPHAQLDVTADSVSFNSKSLKQLTFNGELQSDERLTGKLLATGLVADNQQFGNLESSLDGSLAKHRSTVNLTGGEVEVEFSTSGSWDGEYLTQHFDYAHIKPRGLENWQLQQNTKLRLSATAGNVSPHCWKQDKASICIDDSNWEPGALQSTIDIENFALKSLQPLLIDGYSIDGTVNADIKLRQNPEGLQGALQWRQSHTLLTYTDDIDTFETVLDSIHIDLLSNDTQTIFTTKITGEQGLNVTASATISGPLMPDSSLQATGKGKLPSIELLRPLARRVIHPGELKGELIIDLAVGGTLGEPVFTGGANLTDGSLEMLGAGVTFSEINLSAESHGGDKLQVTGSLRSGDGHAKIFGEVYAAEKPGLVADIQIQGQNLASLRTSDLSIETSPDLKLHISKDVFDISGSIMVPRATILIRDLPQNATPRSSDVIVHSPELTKEQNNETIVTGNVEILLGRDVRFNGFGLNSRLEGALRLTQSRGGFLNSGGTVRVHDGFLTGYGRELRVDRGTLTFTGQLDDPLIDIQVSRLSTYESRQYTIGLRLTGSAQNVITEPYSQPAMSDQDVLSFLLLDQPSSSSNNAGGAALALGLQQLSPGGNGLLGLDEVSFETNNANEAAMVAGKRINDRLYVRYVFGSSGEPGAFRIRYSLGRGFSLESSTGSQQSLDLLYLIDR